MVSLSPGQKTLILQVVNLVAYVFMIVMNTISATKGFNNGITNAVVSNKYPTRFTPAGYAFSIWGLIFFGLGVFVIYQLLPRWRRLDDEVYEKLTADQNNDPVAANRSFIQKLGPFFAINAVVNALWGVIFAYEVFWLSVIFILGILITLIIIYVRLGVGIYKKVNGTPAGTQGMLLYWFVHFPFSMYLGWLSVATIANFAIFFTAPPIHWTQHAETWSVVMQVVAVILGFLFLVIRWDPVPPFVIVWALFAIAAEQKKFEVVYHASLSLASILLVASAATTLYRIYKCFKTCRE